MMAVLFTAPQPAARERPQMKSDNGMYIITTSTNHNGHQLPIDVSIIANHLHSYM
jgi:hypothetical protein